MVGMRGPFSKGAAKRIVLGCQWALNVVSYASHINITATT